MASPTKKTVGQRLSMLLGSATQADLDTIDAEIAATRARITTLEAVREFVANEVLNRPAAPARPSAKPQANGAVHANGAEATDEDLQAVGTYLALHGRKRIDGIARDCGLDQASVKTMLETACEFFETSGVGMWSLTADGKEEFSE